MLDDDALGMNARISRRDFVNGAAVAVGALGAGVPALGAARAGGLIPQDETYPPSRTGMRGSHPGSFEMAHALRDGQKPGDAQDTGETYDLVIVGRAERPGGSAFLSQGSGAAGTHPDP
jgi:spermidine dehydrogenase